MSPRPNTMTLGYDDINVQVNEPSVSSQCFSYTNWTDVSIEKEILRGQELRAIKPQLFTTQTYYDVINIEYQTPPRSRKNGYQGKSTQNRCKMKLNKQRSYSPYSESSMSRQRYSKSCKVRKCPMRIAELAVPTKRHCLDTWRAKNYILPSYMVDRLRKQVMDENPVVRIPDAIHYFKRRKQRAKKCTYSGQIMNHNILSNPPRKIYVKKLTKEVDHAKIKELCAFFGYKIAGKLNKPLNIILNIRLARLSEVVAHDMMDIMKKEKSLSAYNFKYKTIQAEMASKVAIWIDSIMEDSAYIMLEENLKDLEEEEGHVLDFLDDVMVNVLNICDPITVDQNNVVSVDLKSSGHIVTEEKLENSISSNHTIDTHISSNLSSCNIDDTGENTQIIKNSLEESVVDNINENISIESADNNNLKTFLDNESIPEITIDINTSKDLKINDNTSAGSIKTSVSVETSNEDYIPANANGIKNTTDEENVSKIDDIRNEDTISQSIRNELESIVFSIDKQFERKLSISQEEIEDTDLDSSKLFNKDVTEQSEYAILEEQSSGSSIKDLNKTIPDDINKLEDYLGPMEQKNDLHNINNEDSDFLQIAPQNEDDNVSEIFNMFNEDSIDDRYKKVQFVTPIVNEADNIDSVNQSIANFHEAIIQHTRDLVLWTSPSDFFKLNIELQPPNEHILSDADELWPNELLPVLKPSASVNKSVTSLGRIIESDEILQRTPKEPEYYELEKVNIDGHGDNIKSNDKKYDSECNSNLNSVTEAKADIKTTIYTKDSSQNKVVTPSNELEFTIDDELRTLIEDFLDQNGANTKIYFTNSQHLDEIIIRDTNLACGEEQFLKESDVKITLPNNILQADDDSMLHIKKYEDNKKITKTVTSKNVIQNKNIQVKNDRNRDEIEDTTKYICSSLKRKQDYKVDPLTAPSWVLRARCEPIGDNQAKALNTLDLNEIRKWNKELDQGFINLQMWNDWIDCTCKYITDIKQRKDAKKVYATNWTTLKKNIDKDVIFWSKLNKRTHRKLKQLHKPDKARSKIMSSECLCVKTII